MRSFSSRVCRGFRWRAARPRLCAGWRSPLERAPHVDRPPTLLADAAHQFVDEVEFGADHRQVVLGLHREQRRKLLVLERRRQRLPAGQRRQVLLRQFGEVPFHLPERAAELQRARAQERHRFVRRQHRQQRQRRLELRIFLGRRAQQIAHPFAQFVEAGRRQRVDGAFGPPPFPLGLLGDDEPARDQSVDHRVERAVAQLDALVLVPVLQGRGHLVRMHRPLEQQRQHGERQGIGRAVGGHWLPLCSSAFIRIRIYADRPMRSSFGWGPAGAAMAAGKPKAGRRARPRGCRNWGP